MDFERYMELALEKAKSALEKGEFPVGAVIVQNDRIIASSGREGTFFNRNNETEHAEMVALRQLNEGNINRDNGDMTVFSTLEPCLMCYGAILIHNIHRIVYAYEDAMGGGTCCQLDTLKPLYSNKCVQIVPGVLRRKSLELFKRYFSNPGSNYLKDTLLCRYTLDQ